MPAVKSLLLSNKQRRPLANLACDIDPEEVRRLIKQSGFEGAVKRGVVALDDPDIKAEIEQARASKLVLMPGEAWPIEKNGVDATHLGDVRSQWMNITPAMAKKWLDNNFRNRLVNDDTVQAYARDMRNGTWVATHQGVAFNDKDELIDGQHRLLAIIMSGKTIRMMVTFGLPSAIAGNEMTTMDAIDRGRTRSVADQLKIQHGFKDGAVTASICARLAGICFGQRTRRLSVGQTLEIFRAFEESIKWVILRRSKHHGLKQAGVLAGFAFAMATEEDRESPIAGMFETLIDGKHLRPHSPLSYLHHFLISDDAKLLTSGSDRALAELVLQTIYLETKSVEIAKLDPSLDGVEHFKSRQEDRVAKIATLFQLPEAKGSSK